MKYPSALSDVIDAFLRYPGVGYKTAERLALHTVTNLKKEDLDRFINALIKAKDLKECKICGAISSEEVCEICSDTTRTDECIIVVEDSKDMLAIEKTDVYRGKYHILKGLINPVAGIGASDIRLRELLIRLKDENVKEVILALSATVEGEQTSMYIKKLLENTGIRVSKLAHGLPVGANLEYADEVTLLKAIEGRREV